MKKGASSRTGKGRFHPSRIPGHEKFRRAREANEKKEAKRPKTPVYESIKELLNA